MEDGGWRMAVASRGRRHLPSSILYLRFSFQFLFAQENHADHRHEQQHRDDFKRQGVLREQEFAERIGFAFERWLGGVWFDGRQRFHKDGDDGTDGNQSADKAEQFYFAALFFLQIEQHDHEQEQRRKIKLYGLV